MISTNPKELKNYLTEVKEYWREHHILKRIISLACMPAQKSNEETSWQASMVKEVTGKTVCISILEEALQIKSIPSTAGE